MKVRVLKRFNRMDPGTIIKCTQKEYDSWIHYGFVEKVEEPKEKQASSPKSKEIKGSPVDK